MMRFNLLYSLNPPKKYFSGGFLITLIILAIAAGVVNSRFFHHPAAIKPVAPPILTPTLAVKYVGSIVQGKARWGILLLPNGHLSDVEVGGKLGGDFFKVLAITPFSIVFVDQLGRQYVVKK